MVGYLNLCDGQPAPALRQLSAHPPPAGLQASHAYYLGEALFFTRDFHAAAVSFRSANTGPHWLRIRAQAREAEALLAAKDTAASPLLEHAASDLRSPELGYQRSLARRDLGNSLGEREDLVQLAIRSPLHPYVSLALARLAQMSETGIPLTLEERLARTRALIELGQPQAALRELDALDDRRLTGAAEDQAEVARLRAAVLFSLDKDEEANQQIALALLGPENTASEAALLHARRALHNDQREQARAEMSSIATRYANQPAADEAEFLIGWIDLQEGRFERAVHSLTSFGRRHPRSRRRDDAIWFATLGQIAQRHYRQAQASLKAMIRRFPSSDLAPLAHYWQARVSQLSGAPPSQWTPLYADTLRLFPSSFYALLAQERLRESGAELPQGFLASVEPSTAPLPEELRLAQSLQRVGLWMDADREIEEQVQSIHSAPQAMRLGQALQDLGAFGTAYSLATRWLWANAYAKKDGGALALLYPHAHRAIVESEAGIQSVDPFLVWAVMRRESGFHPQAHSVANARGLMQIVPSTGTAIARELALEPPEPDQLFDPQINLKLGTWYLTQLLKRFGHPVLGAAAYNAGPIAVLKWLERRPDLPLDLFVELIPFKETRAYLRQVVADYFIYHQLYDRRGAAPHLSLELPRPSATGISF